MTQISTPKLFVFTSRVSFAFDKREIKDWSKVRPKPAKLRLGLRPSNISFATGARDNSAFTYFTKNQDRIKSFLLQNKFIQYSSLRPQGSLTDVFSK